MAVRLRNRGGAVSGDVDAGYGAVADAFRRNLDDGRETGAAVAVYRDGRKVVDLWGGQRNRITGDPWLEDTLVSVFSTTKGVAALAVAAVVSRGLLDYDAKVVDYWPEFAQAGKETITVRQLLGHQAGLAALDALPTLADIADHDALAVKLAAQAPAWTPGTRYGYHAVTLGWYQSELIRRVDPKGRSLGRFFAEEIAKPLGLDFYIGLPASVERSRVALLEPVTRKQLLSNVHHLPLQFVAAMFNPRSASTRAFTVAHGMKDAGDFNRDELRVVEIPSGNGTATARSIAELYGDAATGGAAIGLTPSVRNALEAPAIPPSGGVRDLLMFFDVSFSLGFGKPTPSYVFGSNGKAFGWHGVGGSVGFADPDTGVGYAYVMNRMGGYPESDPRELALRQAVFRDILRVRPQR